MTVDQLFKSLQKKYSIKSFLDLAEITHSPGKIYQLLNDLYQTSFDPNDRIVFYSSNKVSENLVKHLQDAANFVDIGEWFILFCTPEPPLTSPFQHLQIMLETTKPMGNSYILPDSICAIPWMHLEIKSDGQFSPCCVSTNTKKIGTVQTLSLDDAFKKDYMVSLRKDFLDGKKPDICRRCWDEEDKGLRSIRIQNIKKFKKTFLLDRLENPAISSLDIKFSNVCNFKCRICAPSASSMIANEQHKFLGIPIEVQSKWEDSDLFLNQIVELLPQLTFIDMYGGEPFLIKKFVNVLRIAVEQGYANNIRLHYNSNGSVWPKDFIPYWKYFKEVDIHFSIDAIGERFELQRGGHWKDVEANILKIKNLNMPNLNISLMPTVNIMNIYYIDEVYAWGTKHGFKLFFNILDEPDEFNIKNLTGSAQKLIIEKLKDHPWVEIQKLIRFIRSTEPGNGTKFREKIKWFDSIREEDFIKSHCEIAEAMGYVYNKDL